MAENKIENDCHNPHAPDVNTGRIADEPITAGLLIDGSQINSFDNKLKEEIVAQTLILTALNDGEQQNIKNIEENQHQQLRQQQDDFVSSSLPNIEQTCTNVLVSSHHHDIVNSINAIEGNIVNQAQILQNGESTYNNVDSTQAIEMIAIQQPVTESTIKATLLNTANCHNELKNLDNGGNVLNHQQISEALMEAGIVGSPVVVNSIAIKDAVTEIQFENSTDIQVQQTEVETNAEINQDRDLSHQNISENDEKAISDTLVLKTNEENNEGKFTLSLTNVYLKL